MAESVVTHLLCKLTNLVENEVQCLSGSREDVIAVRGELERIRAFLRVADSLEERDEEVKVWVKQIRDIAYETEDILDELALLLTHDHGTGFSGFLHKMSCCIRNMKAQYRITSEIKKINSRIKNICEGHRRLRHKFVKAEREMDCADTDNTWLDHRGNALLLEEIDLVGIEEPKKKLVGWLVGGLPRREVISIVGMGGLGKSTLAKQVYEDVAVKKHFTIRAWIPLSRCSKIQDLLKDLLQQIMTVIRKPIPPGADSMNSHWLKMIIKDLLQRRRYLIVLDDAWILDEWDAIKHALPTNNCGSRIIVTTRHTNIASTSCNEFNGKVYALDPLTTEQSWTLFCRKTFQGKPCPPHLEEICQYILRKCAGLPLAIVAISGVLATKDKSRIDEWDVIRRSLRAEIDGNDRLKNLKKVLSLSFNDLPYYLKSCFLQLCVFPEGYLIERRRLLRLWIAEGFVERKEGKAPEDVAKEYLHELLNRSLLHVVDTTSDGRITFCRIHGVLRDIIISKSNDQCFGTIATNHSDTWPDKVRRLSVHNTVQTLQANRSLSQLRSLYTFGAESSFINAILCCGIKLLTVLDMQGAPLKRFPSQVVDWYYLRYLSFRYTEIKSIPSAIGKLQNLETLDLKHTNVTELPVEILKLQRLRHLLVYRYENISYFYNKYGFKAIRGIEALRCLHKLCYIEADDDRNSVIMKELGRLVHLRRLGILKLRKEDGRDLCLSIAKLAQLRTLTVSSCNDDEILDLQHLTCPPQFLQRIYLRGRLEALPSWLCSLQSVVKLHLRFSRLSNDPFPSLQNLPNLVHLELHQVYAGQTLCFKAKGFKKLRILGLDNFDELTCIEVEEGAMPYLEEWIIQRCKLLSKLPSGIEYLTKLKTLRFFDMPEELVKKFVQNEKDEDYKKVAHIPDVYLGYWRDGGWDLHSIERTPDGESPRTGSSVKSSELPPCWK